MIIGINGKIGSGKDTVGKIIQWLTKPELDGQYIGFQTYDDITLDRCSPFKIKKFAGKLKTTASLLTGIPVEKFEDQEFKKTLLGPEWGTIRTNPLNAIPVFEDVQFNELMSVRELLQKLGTEAMRDGLHENVWVNALFADYKGLPYKEWNDGQFNPYPIKRESTKDLQFPNWIITDMRFPNEMEAVKDKGGIIIRVVRPKIESLVDKIRPYSDLIHYGIPMPVEHPSETALDDAKFDYEIINDGTIEDLIEKVRVILVAEDII